MGGSAGCADDNAVVFQWNQVEYENLPQPADSLVGPYQYFIPENNDIVGLGYHPASGLMFAVLDRLRPGIPASIAAFCINGLKIGSSPKFWAFPNFEIQALRAEDFEGKSRQVEEILQLNDSSTNQGPINYIWPQPIRPIYATPPKPPTPITPIPVDNSSDFRIISTFEVVVDEKCNRALFVDAGMVEYYNVSFVIQKPALVIYDLPFDGCENRTFQAIRRVEFPNNLATMNPFTNFHMTLDYQSSDCDDLYIYIANFCGHFLVVYDYKTNEFWYYTGHPSFQPIAAESYIVYDETLDFILQAGIYSVALSFPDRYGNRIAYYIAGASTAQYAVSTKVLKNRTKSPRNYHPNDFRIYGYRGSNTQTSRMVFDYTNRVIFYAELQSRRVSCWNVNKPLNPDNIGVVFETDQPFFPLSMFIDSRGYLWFSTGRLPYMYFTNNPIDLSKTNFYFFRIKIRDVINGTVCENTNQL
ncbi:L-dopachrome tautomerase yellow-f2-like [Lutzomyia longipalpis]|uniref:L-dopachrome tautomerase yellow-f2-like n=1 Tax=Lutzomyia longipalpis TaxID=7200 RepID=UPI0024839BA5|nr:L-dopachrome tautomerase yellow-f2-like [Lutzomyia longipalpis]